MYYNETSDKNIEELRDKLHKLLSTNGVNPIEVLNLSQELDKYIVEHYLNEKKCS